MQHTPQSTPISLALLAKMKEPTACECSDSDAVRSKDTPGRQRMCILDTQHTPRVGPTGPSRSYKESWVSPLTLYGPGKFFTVHGPLPPSAPNGSCCPAVVLPLQLLVAVAVARCSLHARCDRVGGASTDATVGGASTDGLTTHRAWNIAHHGTSSFLPLMPALSKRSCARACASGG
jgi:hypothetical protein